MKADIFLFNEHNWITIQEDVATWVGRQWWKWEEEKPTFFSDYFKSIVPLGMIPLENVEKLKKEGVIEEDGGGKKRIGVNRALRGLRGTGGGHSISSEFAAIQMEAEETAFTSIARQATTASSSGRGLRISEAGGGGRLRGSGTNKKKLKPEAAAMDLLSNRDVYRTGRRGSNSNANILMSGRRGSRVGAVGDMQAGMLNVQELGALGAGARGGRRGSNAGGGRRGSAAGIGGHGGRRSVRETGGGGDDLDIVVEGG
jgi:hypothetical protein